MTWPIPQGFSLHTDASWSPATPSLHRNHYSSQQAEFTLATGISADRIFGVSRGDLSSGTVHLTQSDQLDVHCVSIKVVVECFPSDLLDLVKVCELKRQGRENQYGVGIFTTSRPQSSDFQGIDFKITITLPKRRTGVLKIKNFETDMPLFAHQLDNLAPTVHFRTISLRSSNVPMLVDSLDAQKINIETSNAPIQGTFAASSLLNLTTSNSSIRVSAFLQSSDVASFSDLSMQSTNGPIVASIILSSQPYHPSASAVAVASTSSPPIECGGNFSITATTDNAPLSLTFPSAPPLCNFQLKAFSSLSPVDITLPKTYEGAFEVETNMASTFVGFQDNIAIGRTDGLVERRLGFEVDGEVWKKGWVSSTDEGQWRGNVKVVTSMAPVTLRL
ncbi:hypothetical protein BDP27DRAFT_1426536 [Rhodocollybia butyracea]|uniref:DUF7330 domain-containing protein n=1 Tax=Rhodocollybia butyracea TaxID=206335 RepID=A0A9P5PKM8_9AGAR|nr:hypothetical protein BDP27DRAFT_1426536 [Rhodocollybia butyracea]